jgi:hypothetical protein
MLMFSDFIFLKILLDKRLIMGYPIWHSGSLEFAFRIIFLVNKVAYSFRL